MLDQITVDRSVVAIPLDAKSCSARVSYLAAKNVAADHPVLVL